MGIYLGLGSNLGDRRSNLSRAITQLETKELRVTRVSPVIESAAQLPENCPAEWDRPFLNLAVECETEAPPETVRSWIKEIEWDLGRIDDLHWSPRPIDIDILLWGETELSSKMLTVPHARLRERDFVLAPLIALEPRLIVPGAARASLLDWSRRLPTHIPLWMGILNVTPDSFSDGGQLLDWKHLEPHALGMIDAGAHIIDVGGESTRPGGEPVTAETEWARVAPILERLIETRDRQPFGPLISIDTYRTTTARKALRLGVDMVNDVGGLGSEEMIELAGESGVDFVAMHQLSLPVDPKITLAQDVDPYAALEQWLLARLERWEKAGLDLNRIIFDPGIGFGKTVQQNRELLSRAGEFRRHGLRVLIGHSRKSFLGDVVGDEMTARDLATAGLSLNLCQQGVDILRVHNVPINIGIYRGWTLASAGKRQAPTAGETDSQSGL